MSNISIHINGPQGSGKTRLADHLKSLLAKRPLPDFTSEIYIHDGLRILRLPRPLVPITLGRYRTRNGTEVRVICVDSRGHYPIIGLMELGGMEETRHFTAEGKSSVGIGWDLFERISDAES